VLRAGWVDRVAGLAEGCEPTLGRASVEVVRLHRLKQPGRFAVLAGPADVVPVRAASQDRTLEGCSGQRPVALDACGSVAYSACSRLQVRRCARHRGGGGDLRPTLLAPPPPRPSPPSPRQPPTLPPTGTAGRRRGLEPARGAWAAECCPAGIGTYGTYWQSAIDAAVR